MKRFYFAKIGAIALLAALFFTILSCDSLGGDPNGTTTTGNTGGDPDNPTGTTTSTMLPVSASKVLSFNRTGGKAAVSLDPASDNHLYRGTTTNTGIPLAKVLESGVLESLLKLNKDATVDSWPEVEFLMKSPTNEIYVLFKDRIIIKTMSSGGVVMANTTEETTSTTTEGTTSGTTDGEYIDTPVSPTTPSEPQFSILGKFICIKEDGTFIEIIDGNHNDNWVDIYSQTDPITFDKTGNMYYLLTERSSSASSSISRETTGSTQTTISGGNTTTTTIYTPPKQTNAIYKFDPKTGEQKKMAEITEGTWYRRYLASDDGQYLFAEVYLSDIIEGVKSAYLRAIPTADPGKIIDIYPDKDFKSNDDGWFITSFMVSPDNTVYFSGTYLTEKKLSGVFSAKSPDYSITHDIGNIDFAFSYYSIFEVTDDSNTPEIEMYWSKLGGYVNHEQVYFINKDGTINPKNILDTMRTFIPYPNATFSLKTLNEKCNLQLDGTLINEEAIEALDFKKIQLLCKTYFGSGSNSGLGNNQFLIDAFGLLETDLNLTINNASQMCVASDGSVWGITLGGAIPENKDVQTQVQARHKNSFIQLYDKDGKPHVYAPTVLKDGDFLPIKLQMGDGYIYFSCLLKDSTEYHTIKCVSLTDTETLIDVFKNVPDNTNIKISDYSIEGNTLYFSGLKGGTEAISGKIDLTGQAFTYKPIASGYKINKILAY